MEGTTRRALPRLALGTTLLLAATQLLALDVAQAGFSATTSNEDNAVGALTVTPPTDVTGTRTLNLLPVLTCEVELEWTASTTPDLTAYEIRLVDGSGDVLDGPWTVGPDTTSFEQDVLISLLEDDDVWQVRARLSSWASPWVDDAPADDLLCLDLL